MRLRIFLVMLFGVSSCWAEGSCFRTPSQAAVQVGDAEGGGYRLVFVRVDPLGGRAWAGVRSCLHPEWPVVLVAGTAMPAQSRLNDGRAVIEMGHQDVEAGKQVRVMQMDSMVRMEMSGTAMGSGRVGDHVWVRIPGAGDGNGRLELGLVQGKGLMEIGR